MDDKASVSNYAIRTQIRLNQSIEIKKYRNTALYTFKTNLVQLRKAKLIKEHSNLNTNFLRNKQLRYRII